MKLLDLRATPIHTQLQIEEALLRTSSEDYAILNMGSPPAVIMGVSCKPAEWVDQKKLKNIPLIKRFSGGGTVVIDEYTLFLTLICHHSDLVSPYPQPLLEFHYNLLKKIMPKGFLLQENDFTIFNKKCGGNAQCLTKNRWLHHTSYLWDYNPTLMNLLKFPPKSPSYRHNRPHEEFLEPLKHHFHSPEELLALIIQELSHHFHLKKMSLAEAKPFLSKPHRKSLLLLEN